MPIPTDGIIGVIDCVMSITIALGFHLYVSMLYHIDQIHPC